MLIGSGAVAVLLRREVTDHEMIVFVGTTLSFHVYPGPDYIVI